LGFTGSNQTLSRIKAWFYKIKLDKLWSMM
jgi:hypothetical protein